MNEAACIKKLGWEAVKRAVFEHTRQHWDLPCFCNEPCPFFDPTSKSKACQYKWPELEAEKE